MPSPVLPNGSALSWSMSFTSPKFPMTPVARVLKHHLRWPKRIPNGVLATEGKRGRGPECILFNVLFVFRPLPPLSLEFSPLPQPPKKSPTGPTGGKQVSTILSLFHSRENIYGKLENGCACVPLSNGIRLRFFHRNSPASLPRRHQWAFLFSRTDQASCYQITEG